MMSTVTSFARNVYHYTAYHDDWKSDHQQSASATSLKIVSAVAVAVAAAAAAARQVQLKAVLQFCATDS